MNKSTTPNRVVFVSSTTRDLAQYRDVAGAVVEELDRKYERKFRLVKSDMFKETPTGERETAVQTSERWVKEADWVVLIIGFWYGHVPDGKDCSVTEHEFRTAVAASKALFVFMAGAPKHKPNEYRALPKELELEDLKDHRTPPEHQAKFDKFVAAVETDCGPVIFKNVDHFRELLKQTLEKKIVSDLEAALPSDDDRARLAGIIEKQGLHDSVLPAIESARQLAMLKEIHDRLHRIRQFGVRRWREEVLNQWPTDAPPTTDTELAYLAPMLEVTKRLSQIETRFEQLSPYWRTRLGRLLLVVNHFNSDSRQLGNDRNAFIALIDRFASRQQAAFSDTNAIMQRCAGELGRHHDQMISRGKAVLKLNTLSPAEVTTLREEMEQSLTRHAVLQDALTHHADWQREHDRLQGVDDALDEGDGRRPMAVTLAPVIDDLPEIENLAQGAPGLWKLTPAQPKIKELAKQVLRNCTVLRSSETADAYRALRMAFDNLFFEVDIETLNIVEYSRDQADSFEHRLRPPSPPES